MLYILMFAATIAGWVLAGTFAMPYDTDLFGLTLPLIVASTERQTHKLYENAHLVLAYLLAALVLVHIIAALRHRFVQHNDVLTRMWFTA